MRTVQRVVRVFYRDYVNDVSVRSTEPEALLIDRLVPLAERLLTSADNFLGIVDRDDTILQCYLDDDPDTIALELILPETAGCLRLTLPRAQAMSRLRDLPERFDTSFLPGAEHID